jgi:hypothetical protein
MARAKTGFRLDTTKLRRKLVSLGRIRADDFKPELSDFTRKSLATASRMTPVRDYALIKRNQNRQYNHRINYIPSYHEVVNPSLRVHNGKHWLFCDGKWLLANEWKLSDRQWGAYQSLLAERQRRMQTARAPFIAERAQARFLYRKSWSQVAESLGLRIATAGNVESAHSRHEPPKAPARGYGQWRGGDKVLSVDIRNPFLEQESAYKPFSGREIIGAAMREHESGFKRKFQASLRRRVYAMSRK